MAGGFQSKEIPDSSLNSALMASLDLEMDRGRHALRLFKDGVCRKIADLSRRRNLLVPIYRLPPEILANIFQRVQSANNHTVNAYLAIKHLARVSSRWFATVLSTPYLWTHIDSQSHPAFTRSIISRSRGLPLYLSCTLNGSTMAQETAFLELVLAHAGRWRTFQNCSGHIMGLLTKLGADKNLPLLEVFDANAPHNLWPEVPEVILHRAPILHTLSIPFCTFPQGGLVFSNITKLKFSPESGDRTYWQTLLSNTLQLKVLHVTGERRFYRDQPPAFSVVLPKLEVVILESLPDPFIGGLISSICFAPQSYPRVEIRRTDRTVRVNEFGLIFPESPQPQSLLTLIRSMKWMTIRCLPNTHTMFIDAGREHAKSILVFRSFLPRTPSSIFETLVPSSGLQELEMLSVRGLELFDRSAFLESLQRFPSLKRLYIGLLNTDARTFRYHEILEPICNALCSPITADGRTATNRLLPELIQLDVESVGGFKALLPFIQSRCGLANSPHQPDLPAPLQVLRLQPLVTSQVNTDGVLDAKFAEQLREMFEQGSTELIILPMKLN